jgi:hypothetical protein
LKLVVIGFGKFVRQSCFFFWKDSATKLRLELIQILVSSFISTKFQQENPTPGGCHATLLPTLPSYYLLMNESTFVAAAAAALIATSTAATAVVQFVTAAATAVVATSTATVVVVVYICRRRRCHCYIHHQCTVEYHISC